MRQEQRRRQKLTKIHFGIHVINSQDVSPSLRGEMSLQIKKLTKDSFEAL